VTGFDASKVVILTWKIINERVGRAKLIEDAE